DRSPNGEVRLGSTQLVEHVPHNGNGKADRIKLAERAVDLRKRRSNARGKPDFGVVCSMQGCSFQFCPPKRSVRMRSGGTASRTRLDVAASTNAFEPQI